MEMNRLPKFWFVKNDRSKLFKNTVLKYVNEISPGWSGSFSYYGFDGRAENNGTHGAEASYEFRNNPTELTLEEFIELTKGSEFEYGEEILVWVNPNIKQKAIFLSYISGALRPYLTVHRDYENEFKGDKLFEIQVWKNAEKIPPKQDLQITVTLNGKPLDPKDISEETWKNLREKSI